MYAKSKRYDIRKYIAWVPMKHNYFGFSVADKKFQNLELNQIDAKCKIWWKRLKLIYLLRTRK